ncbi:hypothetical protein [Bacillus sp. 3255]|uniref:hypothetical protein n=1 Tax=Bacillus sp. 3255 TaxID=2817904 RepID=UPI00285BAE5A|nr:hypothetical protein [Bacillus sp. 3255]MDR6883573.1 hypothetical protein [Bacillus sp. 3255]
MRPIKLRMNFMRSQEPFRSAYLADDGRFAYLPAAGSLYLLAVVSSDYPELYAQDGEPIFLGHVSHNCGPDTVAAVAGHLQTLTVYKLFTEFMRDDGSGFMLINEPDVNLPAEPPFHEYGRR